MSNFQGAPVMIEGMRPSGEVRQKAAKAAEAAQVEQASGRIPASSEDLGTVYQSKFRRYRVQVTATPDYIDPLTGRKIVGRQIVATFQEGVWINRAKDMEERAMVDKALQSNPWFGLGRDFWLSDERKALDDKRKIADSVEAFKANPEAVRALVSELAASGAIDFTLPPPPA